MLLLERVVYERGFWWWSFGWWLVVGLELGCEDWCLIFVLIFEENFYVYRVWDFCGVDVDGWLCEVKDKVLMLVLFLVEWYL